MSTQCQFCHFCTSMLDMEVCAVWAKDQKQVRKLMDKDVTHKASMETSVTQVCLAEEAIKNGMVVETIG